MQFLRGPAYVILLPRINHDRVVDRRSAVPVDETRIGDRRDARLGTPLRPSFISRQPDGRSMLEHGAALSMRRPIGRGKSGDDFRVRSTVFIQQTLLQQSAILSEFADVLATAITDDVRRGGGGREITPIGLHPPRPG